MFREIKENSEETDGLIVYKKRLQKAVAITSEAEAVNENSLKVREKRMIPEADANWGPDKADVELKKEKKVTSDIMKALINQLNDTEQQVPISGNVHASLYSLTIMSQVHTVVHKRSRLCRILG